MRIDSVFHRFFAYVIGTFLATLSLSVFGAGRQLTGVYTPAATPPLSPEEAAKKMTLPDGFEARIFASEPQVINPVAMTWDERGRLWVVELYEYPLGAPAGAKPRDQIKILEDTDNDGRADKVTVFADGLNLATGILLGYGGAFVGQAPHLLFLEDTDGDDKADKRTILKTGFGLEDRHELLNGFTWGPDGYLYMTHGVFTRSTVKNPDDPNDDGVLMTAAVARYHPRTKKFEIFAEGTSNPWGVDFDRAGNAFVSACVIDHLFHMAPGGIYVRQAGSPPFPYAYELLPSIVDHKHFRAAYAGAQVYQGDQYPEEYKGTILMGNIHDSAIHQDKLTPDGSSFKASFMKDFVRSNDGWFRPVSTQIGPDGAVWIMDWYDKYPCYQNANADPEGVDREHGRIWRIVYTGNEKGKPVPSHPAGMNLAKSSTEELVGTLDHPNVWQRRMAQRILSERRESSARAPLLRVLNESKNADGRIAALWTLHTSGQVRTTDLEKLATDSDAVIRTWVARIIGERKERSDTVTSILKALGADENPSVRLAVATAVRQFITDQLTIDTRPDEAPEPDEIAAAALGPIFNHPQSANDPLIPFMLWMDTELWFAHVPYDTLNWYAENGMRNAKLAAILLRKGMRRICDSRSDANIETAVSFLDKLGSDGASLVLASLDGLIEGQKGRAFTPGTESTRILAKLRSNPNAEIANRAQQLGTIWGDAAALGASIKVVSDSSKPQEERVQAIQSLRQQRTPAVRDALLQVVSAKAPEPVLNAAVTTLGTLDADELPDTLLKNWKQLSPASRNTAIQVLSSRSKWAQLLISAVENKNVAVGEIPPTVVRTLVTSKDDYVRNRATKVIGKYRESSPDKAKVIADKKRVVLSGPVDLEKGHQLAQKTCFTCHKLYGEGADVGPDLTGVGRSTLDALLSNVIDPNQIIGAGYENVEVTLKDDRTVSGRMIENTDSRVKILSIGPKEEVIAKSDIANLRISELSVMPEGLEQMPDDDFRNLIWFIFSPPQDKKPFSIEDERKEILKAQTSTHSTNDGESIALWNPEWRVNGNEASARVPEYLGRSNVLMTHPFDESKPATIERAFDVPVDKTTTLTFAVASHDQGDWELRVFAGEKLLKKQIIGHEGLRWQRISVDLTPFAGRKVPLRLENKANDWNWEFGYWNDIKLTASDLQQRAAK